MSNPDTAQTQVIHPVQQDGPDLIDQLMRTIKGRWRRLTGRSSQTQLSITKVIAFVVTILVWTYSFYYGWVVLPNLNALGGVVGILLVLMLVAAIIASAFTKQVGLRLTGLAGAVFAGGMLATRGTDMTELFADFTFASTFGLLVAFIATFAVALWICRSPRRAPRVRPVVRPQPEPTGDPDGIVMGPPHTDDAPDATSTHN